MSNGFIVVPLSSSIGGAPVTLDQAVLPGKLVHANPVDSGGNDIVRDILVGNPNPNQITLLVQTQGPGITTPRVVRIDVPPTAEGTDVRIFYTPFIMAPGFSYYITAQIQAGNEAPYVYGYVERHATAQFYGYGGLLSAQNVSIGSIAVDQWAVVPFAETRPTIPINVTTDPANNRLSLDVPGVWSASIHVSLAFDRLNNADRILFLRVWNQTDGSEVTQSPFPLYVEQSSTGGSWSIPTVPVDIGQDLINKNLQIEIGGAAHAFNNIQLAKAGFNIYLIDPLL